MNIQDFSEWFDSLDDIEIIEIVDNKILFDCVSQDLVVKITKISEKTENTLALHSLGDKICMCLHAQNLENFYKAWNFESKKGIPDLSWVTCKQMADELKSRSNITVALLWIEEKGSENISLEASGNPTTLCGLLSRGLNMAIQFADKNLHFHQNEDQ